MTELRRVDVGETIEAIHRLWSRCLGSSWALQPQPLYRRLQGIPSGCRLLSLGIYRRGHLIGYVAAQHRAGRTEAGLVVLLVDPDHRRQGLGTRLCQEVVAAFRSQGVRSIRLGAGGAAYFWPGVPQSCAGAVDFFQAQGWTIEETSYDLVQDISGYSSQISVPEAVDVSTLRPEQSDALMAFVSLHFPNWAATYAQAVRAGKYSDIIVASCDDGIAGVTHIQAVAHGDGHPWQPLLGRDMGVLGTVGVDERYRRRGIGLTMVDFGTAQLRLRGVRHCLIGWTWLTEWYGRLGYQVWQTYDMCVRTL